MWNNEQFQHWLYRLKMMFYIGFLLVFLLVFIIEIKHVFNINIFPGYDGPIDNIYYKIIGKLFN
jgi:hypothetical protein